MLHPYYILLITSFLFGACAEKKNQNYPAPSKAQLIWQEAELGVLICYELHTFNPGRYNQAQARITPIQNADQFNPEELDTDQWVRAAKDAGARFAILTASHESGFRLWQSEVNPFCLSAVKWGDGKRDIVGEFMKSCLRYDILPGIYLGTRWNAQLGVYDFKVTERSSLTQKEYNDLIEREVREICTKYGDWFEFWFDGGAHGPAQGGPDVLSIVSRYQPNALFYHNLERADARWGGSESGTVNYPCWATFPYVSTGAGESAKKAVSANNFELLKSGDPDGKYWMPAMSDAPLRGYGGHEWFWEPDDEHLIYPLDKLMDMYEKSVGRNSTLILGITPDTSGKIPDPDVRRLQELGAEINNRFRDPIAKKRLLSFQNPESVTLPIKNGIEVSTLVIQENIRYGERVREFLIEAKINGQWRSLNKGTCIGHKRIVSFDPIKPEEIKLTILASQGKPKIKSLVAY
jgi:alpha-L-fucosidase